MSINLGLFIILNFYSSIVMIRCNLSSAEVFFLLNIGCLILNVLFNLYGKKDYSLFKLRVMIYIIFALILFFLIENVLFFFDKDPEDMLNSFDQMISQILFFNISIFIYGLSISLFLFTILRVDDSVLDMKIPSYLRAKKGTIKMGRVMKYEKKKFFYYLSLKDLEKHMFVCGATGTGKTNFLQYFLINLNKKHAIPFFLVEFKGEYHFLQKKIENLLILYPGENFSINIFNPGNSNPKIHAERIFDILKSGRFLDENADFSPQMEKVLVDVLVKVCQSREYRNWKGFEYFCDLILNQKQKEIPLLHQTLISIKNRIRRFSSGPLRAIFDKKSELEIDALFENNVLLDLSSIIRLGGEKEDALFFLNMILKYLWDKNLTRGAFEYKGIRHISIIEDAQYFAPNGLIDKNKLTTYLEDIALLQRGTGECLITIATRPDISREILANNGIVVTFKNHMEKELMSELLNLEAKKKNYLSMLEEGNCIIRINSIKQPFLLEIPLIERKSLPLNEIFKNNESILRNKSEFNDNDVKDKHCRKKMNSGFFKDKVKRLSAFGKKKIKNRVLKPKTKILEQNIEELQLKTHINQLHKNNQEAVKFKRI